MSLIIRGKLLPNRRGRNLLFVAFLFSLLPSLARADWPVDGLAVCTAGFNQNEPRLTTDGAGGVLVTWQDFRAGGAFDIYAQRVDASGAIRWTTNGVPICTVETDQKFPQLVSDGAGGAFIVWKDRRSNEFDIYAQHIDSQGVPQWGVNGRLVCNAAGTQQDPVLVRDASDGVFIAWRDFRGGPLARLYGQRLNGSGQALWAVNGIPLVNMDGQYDAVITTDGAGGALLVWYDYRSGTNWDIYAQRLDATGNRLWGTGGAAICTAAGNQYYPQILADDAGGFFTTWYDERSGNGPDIYAARLTAAGSRAAGWPADGRALCTAPWEQFSPTLTSDGAGGIIVTWYDQRESIEIYGQRVTGAGVVSWATDGVRLCNTPGAWPVVTSDQSGGAFVAWYGTPADNGLDISGQHVTGAGSLYPGWTIGGEPLSQAPNDQYKPSIVADGNGGAFVAWTDGRDDVGDIYLTRITPPLPNLNATLTPDGFSSPVVPRSQPDASPTNAQLSGGLRGDGPPTWLNWGIQTGGAGAQAAWDCRILLDGVAVDNALLQMQAEVSAPGAQLSATSSGGFVRAVNGGPVSIRGGRHTLTSVVDAAGTVTESNESDNSWSGQWVWSPIVMANRAGTERMAPPERGTFAQPNCDGFRFDRQPASAWVASVAPQSPNDNYDIYLYDDYSGSQSGFSHLLKTSAQAANAVDFVVGSATGTPNTVYPAAVRTSGTAADRYTIDQADASGRRSALGQARWLDQKINSRLADVYEGYFVAGKTYYMSLMRTYGTRNVPLAISVFPSVPGLYNRAEAIATSQELGDGTWVLAFTSPVTGWYPVVVHRLVGTNALLPQDYSFSWGDQVSAVGEDGAPHAGLTFGGASPNPVVASTRLAFTLPDAAPVALRLFDVNGRLVRTLVDGPREAGAQTVAWDGRDSDGAAVASGLYFARFEAAGRTIMQRLTVVR